MKPIKITVDNVAQIEAALQAVNGRAQAHCYTTFTEIESLAETAEDSLGDLGIPKGLRHGASWNETSGGRVSNSYDRNGHRRQATRVMIERRVSGWYLTTIAKAEISQQGGGAGRLTLTADQDAEAVRRMRSSYSVKAAQ